MKDATDFAWASAKAAHAVLLCEMERGTLDWTQIHRIDRIRRAHAPKHTTNYRQNWAKSKNSKRPWYCKMYQSGSCSHNKDHENGGKCTSTYVPIVFPKVGRQPTLKKIVKV